MVEKEFSPLRNRASRKPWPKGPDIVIYYCNHCSQHYQNLSYELPTNEPICCDRPMELLKPLSLEDVSPDYHVDYQIVGGYNQSAIQVYWKTKQPEEQPEWVLLKTFTGDYIKYVIPKKIPPLVFPLADEDAYVYCDEPICLQCVFRCKRGFIIYAYFKSKGLIMVPLDKMSARY